LALGRSTGRALLLIFLSAVLIALATVAPSGAATKGSTLAFGIPTVVDPIRGAGEPYIALDARSDPWIAAPGGSTVLSSFYWQSFDGGQTFMLHGPPGGHWLCPTGGSDSSVVIDRRTGTVYLADQQNLAQVAMAVIPNGTGFPEANCFAEPAQTADRPFFALLHPTGLVQAPQYVQDGHTPIMYESWACDGCLGGGSTIGGLAFAWSVDGITWHPADPGNPADTPVTDQAFEASGPSSFLWHGTMAVDPKTGYVFTGISCGGGAGCPDGSSKNEFGVLVGKPGPKRTDPSNVGQFQSIAYQPAATREANGTAIPEDGSLFPVVTMDPAGTLYEMWVQGDGFADPNAKPPASSWHVYYAYSKDQPDHKHWSKPIQVDAGPQTTTSTFGWMASGDPGKLAFLWLGTNVREHPTKQNPHAQWWPFVAITTNGDTPHPTFQQTRVGINPSHIGDICLQGLDCSVTVPPGNRNMADFISIDIGPDGAAQATWASDANQIATLPTSLVPGVPVTMTAHQIAGPKLRGSGTVSTAKFSTRATAGGSDPAGDARFPGLFGPDVPQMDLRGVRLGWTGRSLQVHIPLASLATLASPDPTRDVWWIVTWQFAHKIWFAKADSDLGEPPSFTAGAPASYDRPGLAPYTIPDLVDYRGGTTVTGAKVGNELLITVPASLVGGPKTGSVLESVTAWTMLADDLPPFTTAGPGNVPQIVDAAPAIDVRLAR